MSYYGNPPYGGYNPGYGSYYNPPAVGAAPNPPPGFMPPGQPTGFNPPPPFHPPPPPPPPPAPAGFYSTPPGFTSQPFMVQPPPGFGFMPAQRNQPFYPANPYHYVNHGYQPPMAPAMHQQMPVYPGVASFAPPPPNFAATVPAPHFPQHGTVPFMRPVPAFSPRPMNAPADYGYQNMGHHFAMSMPDNSMPLQLAQPPPPWQNEQQQPPLQHPPPPPLPQQRQPPINHPGPLPPQQPINIVQNLVPPPAYDVAAANIHQNNEPYVGPVQLIAPPAYEVANEGLRSFDTRHPLLHQPGPPLNSGNNRALLPIPEVNEEVEAAHAEQNIDEAVVERLVLHESQPPSHRRCALNISPLSTPSLFSFADDDNDADDDDYPINNLIADLGNIAPDEQGHAFGGAADQLGGGAMAAAPDDAADAVVPAPAAAGAVDDGRDNGALGNHLNNHPAPAAATVTSDIDENYYAEHRPPYSITRGGGNVESITIHALRFHHREEVADIRESFPIVFDEFLRRILRAHGRDPDTAVFSQAIQHPDLSESNGIFISFRNMTIINGVSVMNRLTKIAQSTRSVMLAAPLSLQIHISDRLSQQSANNKRKRKASRDRNLPGRGGGGGGGGEAGYFDRELGIRRVLHNKDSLCLARAFLVGKAAADLKSLSNGRFATALEIRNAELEYKSITRSISKQGREAATLLANCGIPIDRADYGLGDLEVIAKFYRHYRIKVYTRPLGQAHYSVVDDGIFNAEARKVIYLAYRNNHYEPFTPTRRTLGNSVMPEPDDLRGRGGNDNFFDRDLRIRCVLRNNDSLCLARAFLVAKAAGDLKAVTNGRAATAQEISNAEKAYRSLTRSMRRQGREAVELLEVCGLDTNRDDYGLHDLEIIAQYHPNYKIKVFTRPPGHHRYSVVEGGLFNPNGNIPVYMAFRDAHYEPFTPTRGTIGMSVCQLCNGQYKKRSQHRCPKTCKKCKTNACVGGPTAEILCEDCNVLFTTQKCYDLHKLRRARSTSACEKFKVCFQCDRYYLRNSSVPHICDTPYCHLCKVHRRRDHECTWAPPTTKHREDAKKAQESYKIVVFDLETVLNDNQPNSEQFANVVCWVMYCHDCAGKPEEVYCSNCPVKKGVFAHPNNGEPEFYVVDRFIDFLLTDPSCKDATAISHNGSAFDNHFILRRLYERGYIPQIIANGNKIMSMTVKSVNDVHPAHNRVRFKDSYLLIPAALASLPQAFGLQDAEKGMFPYYFNKRENWGKVLPHLPAEEFYGVNEMKPERRELFQQWYNAHKGNAFNFDEEIIRYCANDVKILKQALIAYSSAYLKLTGWDPVIQALTYASFSMFILKMESLQPNQLGILPENGFTTNDVQSHLATCYLEWIQHTEDIALRTSLSTGGEHKITVNGHTYKVDGFHEESNTVYEVHGCFYHGCPVCANPNSRHPFRELTMAAVHKETVLRSESLRSAGYNVIEVYEHEIRAMLDGNRAMKTFFDRVKVVSRLRPRDSFQGGRTQPYRLHAAPDASKGERLAYLDFCSLYPYVCSRVAAYPRGQPKVIREKFRYPDPTFRELPYRGLIKCDVLVPRDCKYPIIGVHIRDKLIIANCFTCARDEITSACTHSDEERKFTVTVCDIELREALRIGYTIIRYHEVWHWPDDRWEVGMLFRDITDKFYGVKTCASGWPPGVTTQAEKDAYLDRIKDTLHVDIRQLCAETGLEVAKNTPLRTVAKLVLNSLWGKTGERPDKCSHHFVHCASDEFGKIISDSTRELTNLQFVTRDVALMILKSRAEYTTPAPYTNVVFAAITTATARILLWRLINKLQDRVCYVDTDSVIFIERQGEWSPPTGDQLGDLTDEIPEGWDMVEFVALAPKLYSYQLRNRVNGAVKTTIRMKGVTLDYNTTRVVTHELMRNMALKMAAGDDVDPVETSRVHFVKKLGIDLPELFKCFEQYTTGRAAHLSFYQRLRIYQEAIDVSTALEARINYALWLLLLSLE